MTKLKLDDYIKLNFCFFCAEKPKATCFKKHKSFLGDINKIADELYQINSYSCKAGRRKQKMTEWKAIEPTIWKPEKEGDSIEGILVYKDVADKAKEKSAMYKLDVGGNDFKVVWGSTILDSRMQLVDIGTRVKITFKEKVKNSKNQDLKIYKVEVAAN